MLWEEAFWTRRMSLLILSLTGFLLRALPRPLFDASLYTKNLLASKESINAKIVVSLFLILESSFHISSTTPTLTLFQVK